MGPMGKLFYTRRKKKEPPDVKYHAEKDNNTKW
jgi:hypothetical protein